MILCFAHGLALSIHKSFWFAIDFDWSAAVVNFFFLHSLHLYGRKKTQKICLVDLSTSSQLINEVFRSGVSVVQKLSSLSYKSVVFFVCSLILSVHLLYFIQLKLNYLGCMLKMMKFQTCGTFNQNITNEPGTHEKQNSSIRTAKRFREELNVDIKCMWRSFIMKMSIVMSVLSFEIRI